MNPGSLALTSVYATNVRMATNPVFFFFCHFGDFPPSAGRQSLRIIEVHSDMKSTHFPEFVSKKRLLDFWLEINWIKKKILWEVFFLCFWRILNQGTLRKSHLGHQTWWNEFPCGDGVWTWAWAVHSDWVGNGRRFSLFTALPALPIIACHLDNSSGQQSDLLKSKWDYGNSLSKPFGIFPFHLGQKSELVSMTDTSHDLPPAYSWEIVSYSLVPCSFLFHQVHEPCQAPFCF